MRAKYNVDSQTSQSVTRATSTLIALVVFLSSKCARHFIRTTPVVLPRVFPKTLDAPLQLQLLRHQLS